MASEYQLSMLSRGLLFEPQVKDQYLTDLRSRGVPQEAQRAKALAEWVDALETSRGTKETSLEQTFNQKVLHEVLGYKVYPATHSTAWPKTPTTITQINGEPDVVLGEFQDGEAPEFAAVLELKGPNVQLDKPQARAGALTPVQQAFTYGEQILGVRWVLVSNMRVIRLYSVESPNEAVSLDLSACVVNGRPTPCSVSCGGCCRTTAW